MNLSSMILVLSVFAASVSAQADLLKKVKTPTELQSIVKNCRAEVKTMGDLDLSCPTIERFKLVAEVSGDDALEAIYAETGFSQRTSGVSKAADFFMNSMREQLLSAIPEIEDGYEENFEYYQDTVDSVNEALDGYAKRGYRIFVNDPYDHDVYEAAILLWNESKSDLIVIDHLWVD